MELDWLETFLAVADQGGFTAAASQVHRSQSRVSAHIAALERELGVLLIDRSRRPAVLTAAGQIFATHAREILVDVGAARSAISVLRSLDQESISVLTTPCIGGAFFPDVIADLLVHHPQARVELSEHGWPDSARRHPADGFVLAVLPTLSHPQPPGMQERVLWREPIRAVLPPDHELARDRASGGPPLAPERLADQPLVISGMSMDAVPEIVTMLAARGLATAPRTTVDAPQTLVSMVRKGVGIGIVNAVALEGTDTSGLAVLDFDDPDMIREVAAYWYDELLTSHVGLSLHRRLFQAPLPAGAVPVA